MTKEFNPNYPIVLGLSGKALTGKTVTGDAFGSVKGPREVPGELKFAHLNRGIFWEHLFFAMPLKQMATIRLKTEGEDYEDRVRYQLHELLLEVFGRSPLWGAPPYEDLVDMVNQIATYPIETEGKPRKFLQDVGTNICRAYDPNCWVNWMDQKIKQFVRVFHDDVAREERADQIPAVVISDVRFPNEGEMISSQPNGLVVRFSASDQVRQTRSLERDKKVMNEAELNHESELSVDLISGEYVIDLDTTHLTVDEQVMATYNVLNTYIRGIPNE